MRTPCRPEATGCPLWLPRPTVESGHTVWSYDEVKNEHARVLAAVAGPIGAFADGSFALMQAFINGVVLDLLGLPAPATRLRPWWPTHEQCAAVPVVPVCGPVPGYCEVWFQPMPLCEFDTVGWTDCGGCGG